MIKRKLLMLIIALILLVSTIFSGIYFYTNNKTKDSFSNSIVYELNTTSLSIVKEDNVYNDYLSVKKQIKYNDTCRIMSFDVDFDKNGIIKKLDYIIACTNSDTYSVNLNTEKNEYCIEKLTNFTISKNAIDEVNFFKKFKLITKNISLTSPRCKIKAYCVANDWRENKAPKFKIDGDTIKSVNEKDLENMKGYSFVFIPYEAQENSLHGQEDSIYIYNKSE